MLNAHALLHSCLVSCARFLIVCVDTALDRRENRWERVTSSVPFLKLIQNSPYVDSFTSLDDSKQFPVQQDGKRWYVKTPSHGYCCSS